MKTLDIHDHMPFGTYNLFSMKEKAKELYLQMYRKLPFDKEVTTENKNGKWKYDPVELAKEHALIAVEEIIKQNSELGTIIYRRDNPEITIDEYWQSVKEEIEKL